MYSQWPDFGLSIPFFIERNRTPKTGLHLLHLSSLIKVVLRLARPLSVTEPQQCLPKLFFGNLESAVPSLAELVKTGWDHQLFNWVSVSV